VKFRSMNAVRVIAVAAAAAAGAGFAAPGGAAAAPGGTRTVHHARVGVHYAVEQPLCAAPTAHRAACFAIRRVEVSKNTPGARPYRVSASYDVGPSGGLTPGDLATAYGYDPATGGTGQIVGIVDAYNDPTIEADLQTFDTQYGITTDESTMFEKVGQTGSALDLPKNDPSGWSGEEALDVEAVRGACHACKIILVEADDPGTLNLAAGAKTAVKLGATELSNSYGAPEPVGLSKKQRKHFAKAIAKKYDFPGVVVTASTGDEGWFSWDLANSIKPSAEAPNLPAALPSVVAVGGTRLTLSAEDTRVAETVWNNNGPGDTVGIDRGPAGASGGGCSTLFKAHSWQAKVPGYSKTGCDTNRLAADIAADGDPQSGYDVYTSYSCGGHCDTGWNTIGGTSLSSPLIAAMWALAGGSGGAPYPAVWAYAHFDSADGSLYDVTQGGNAWCDGISHKACVKATLADTGGNVKNPNDIAVTFTHKHRRHTVVLGTLDCGFKTHTSKPKRVKHKNQCYAAEGYDGPSGVGVPSSLTALSPITPQ
jgi:hypothetical protein